MKYVWLVLEHLQNTWWLYGAVALILGAVMYVAGVETERLREYKELCVADGGTPAYNGKHWICYKGK